LRNLALALELRRRNPQITSPVKIAWRNTFEIDAGAEQLREMAELE
jgi:hypothetical protein